MNRFNCTALILAAICITAYAENITFSSCDADSLKQCTINIASVEPCAEAANKLPCKIKRGKVAKIEFDYTPNFCSPTLKTRAYWVTANSELPFVDMDMDACKRTSCPAVNGTQEHYNYGIDIRKFYPKGTYNLKWKLWGEDEKNQMCCFMFKIKIY